MAISTIYADPELADEYTAGAWAAASHAHRIAVRLAVCAALILGPGATTVYALGSDMATKEREAVVVADRRADAALNRAVEVEQRLLDLESQLSVNTAVLGTGGTP